MYELLQRVLFACAVLSFGTPAQASAALTPVMSGTAHQALLAIAMDGNNGIAVGAAGDIRTTTDAGVSWQLSPRTTARTLMGVDIRGDFAIIVGQMGLILIRDGGSDWKSVPSGLEERLLSVSINADGHAIAVGAFGNIVESNDRGRTWTSAAPDWMALVKTQVDEFRPHLYAVELDDAGTATAVGEIGVVLRRSAGQTQWQVLHIGDPINHVNDASLFALDLRADGVGYAVGQEGAVLRSDDGGQAWVPVNTGTRSILLGVSSSANGEVLVTGMYAMLSSTDDGKTWKSVGGTAVVSSWYLGVVRPEGGRPLVVGNHGNILCFE